jgi:hypothetical protein
LNSFILIMYLLLSYVLLDLIKIKIIIIKRLLIITMIEINFFQIFIYVNINNRNIFIICFIPINFNIYLSILNIFKLRKCKRSLLQDKLFSDFVVNKKIWFYNYIIIFICRIQISSLLNFLLFDILRIYFWERVF